ncbi:MBL fold metallo-hydrolase [Halosimplex marinum]|uniref:MBL fold metallo-hydrolase n=1 Tax=Halosimplex marinum TaxID=3396620 RepID=UPI003F55F94E
MIVTVLGSGDATGVPAPLCGCEYCRESERRRRPAVLVRSGSDRLVFDIGPDIGEQLHEVGVTDPDAFFLTHAHGDHAGGLPRLGQAAKWDAAHLESADAFAATDPDSFSTAYELYLTETARARLDADFERIDDRRIDPATPARVGDLRVDAFPVEHHRPTFETLGFTVSDGTTTVGYAPDMRSFVGGPPDRTYDLFVCEGAAVLGQPVHGPGDELREAIDAVDAERVVLVNANEHIQRAHTDELRARATDAGFELGSDFRTYEL